MPDQEHVRELEALGRVERHQRDRVLARPRVCSPGVVAARERELLQEAVERRLGRAAHVVLGEVQDLEHARPARLARHRIGVEARRPRRGRRSPPGSARAAATSSRAGVGAGRSRRCASRSLR